MLNRYDQRCVRAKNVLYYYQKLVFIFRYVCVEARISLCRHYTDGQIKSVNLAECFQKSTYFEVEKQGDSVNQFLQLSF